MSKFVIFCQVVNKKPKPRYTQVNGKIIFLLKFLGKTYYSTDLKLDREIFILFILLRKFLKTHQKLLKTKKMFYYF